MYALLKNVWHATKVWRPRKSSNELVCIYLFKGNNGNTRRMCHICSKLTIKTPEWRQRRRLGFSIVNFEQILHTILVFLLLDLNKRMSEEKFTKIFWEIATSLWKSLEIRACFCSRPQTLSREIFGKDLASISC